MSEAEQQLQANDESGFDQVQLLIDGTSAAYDGSLALQEAVSQIATGVGAGSDGAAEIEAGLNSLSSNLATVSDATTELHSVYTQIEAGLRTFSDSFADAAELLEQSLENLSGVQTAIETFLSENPEIAADRLWQKRCNH